ncbi:MAG: hypothetical protein FWG20_01465 [Candidatus Cloacimonetes bacterium]|nr:hypothetical protein [Candidatus Cloacimonadota bacterium]
MLLNNIKLVNLYYLTLYAFQNLSARNFEDVVTQDYENLHDLFAAILIHGITNTVKRGGHRDYVKHEGVFPTASGRVNVAETIKQQTLILGKIVCEYEDFEANSLSNQALKSVIMIMIKQGKMKQKNKESLRKLLLYFSDTKLISPTLVQWNMIKTHRANRTYQLLLGVCKLIIDGLIYLNENGMPMLRENIEDDKLLATLYEKAILSYYIKHHLVFRPKTVNMAIHADLRFDISLNYGQNILLFDTRYLDRVVQPDVLKTFHIKTKNEKQTINAILLYPKSNNLEDINGVNVSLKALDLKEDWAVVRQHLDSCVHRLVPQQ